MKRTIATLALASVCGCGEGVGVEVYAERDASPVLEEASSLLGVWLEQGGGPIVLELVGQAPGEPAGRLLVHRPCLRVIRASYDPVVVAHELGHAFGLEHADDPSNVMTAYTDDDSTRFTEAQQEKIDDSARRLSACR